MNGRPRTTEPTLPRILFIDDDARLLSGIRRNLRRHRRDWEFAFAEGGANGIFALEQAPVDVLVTDLKMPGVAGDAVLRYAAEHYPDTVRVVMSGYADRSVTLETVQLAHQFLAKPCEGQILRDRLDRIVGLRRVIVDEALRSGLGGVTSLPATPSLFGELLELMASEDASVQEMTKIVQRDPSLSATVLKVVNSAFVGMTPTVTRVPHAMSLLGVQTVRDLVLGAKAMGAVAPGDRAVLEHFQRHAWYVASVARAIAPPELKDLVGTLAYLHDVGFLFLRVHRPQLLGGLAPGDLFEQLQAAHAVTHADLGGYLLGLWGLPRVIVEAVTDHPAPRFAAFGAAEVLHVAEALVHEHTDLAPPGAAAPLDEAGLDALGLLDRLAGWREQTEETVGAMPTQ